MNQPTNKFHKVQSVPWSSDVYTFHSFSHPCGGKFIRFIVTLKLDAFFPLYIFPTIEKMQLYNNGKWHTEQTMREKLDSFLQFFPLFYCIRAILRCFKFELLTKSRKKRYRAQFSCMCECLPSGEFDVKSQTSL